MDVARNIFTLCEGKAGELDIGMFDELPTRFNTHVGIYVVMNSVFYVGTSTYTERDRERYLYHHEIVEAVLERDGRSVPDEEIDRMLIDNERLMQLLEINDAGLATFNTKHGQKRFEIGGSGGGSFHAIPEEDKIRSASIAKGILGSDVQVVLL